MRMRYQIKYKEDLDIIDIKDLKMERVAFHFAQKGYEYLYVYQNGSFYNSISFSEFRTGEIWKKCSKIRHQQYKQFLDPKKIEDFFYSNPSVDRLILLDTNQLYGEINLLDELALQNNVVKNLMAIRYIGLFRNDVEAFLKKFKKVYLMADDDVFQRLRDEWPDIPLHQVKKSYDYKKIRNFDSALYLDFLYGNKVMKAMDPGYKLVDLNTIVEKIALRYLIEYCKTKRIILKFYKLQVFNGLTCLHPLEQENFKNRINKSHLAQNENYLRKFAIDDRDYNYIKKRKYQISLRSDNGFAFVQENCQDEDMHVINGIRESVPLVKESAYAVHFYGPCTTYGIMTPDDKTVVSFFQKLSLKNGLKLKAVNHGGLHGNNVLNSIMLALNTPVNSGDALIFLDVLDDFSKQCYPGMLDVNEWFNHNKSLEDVYFFDFPGHCNSKGNLLMAEGVFDDIKDLYIKMNIKEMKIHAFNFFSENNISYNPLKWFIYTNGDAVKFYRKIKSVAGKNKKFKKNGALVCYEDDDIPIDYQFILNASKECGCLYVFSSGENLPGLCQIKTLKKLQKKYKNVSNIVVIQLEHFFSAARFLDSFEKKELLFLEESFYFVALKELDVNIRFIKKNPKDVISQFDRASILEVCEKHNITVREI